MAAKEDNSNVEISADKLQALLDNLPAIMNSAILADLPVRAYALRADPSERHADGWQDPPEGENESQIRDPRPVGDRRTFGPAHMDDRPDPPEGQMRMKFADPESAIRSALDADPAVRQHARAEDPHQAQNESQIRNPSEACTAPVQRASAHCSRAEEEHSAGRQNIRFCANAKETRESGAPSPVAPKDDSVSGISQYYDERVTCNYARRKQDSRYAWIRNFNNWVKSVLIAETIAVVGSNIDVIDIGCGQGGDLKKWNGHGIRTYIGVDISTESIRRATVRYRNLRAQLDFEAHFVVDDASKPGRPSRAYSVISMMFALHYFFESYEEAGGLFESLRRRLLPGGRVIGVVSDASVILHRARRSLRDIGNVLYRVVPYDGPRWRSSGRKISGFGNAYRFEARATRDDILMKPCDEYLVPKPVVEQLARNVGFRVVKWQNLQDFFYDHWEDEVYSGLLEKMGVANHDITLEEWDFVRLYNVFVLERPLTE
jgi:mRNA (guanine-N7-)-methyltransferase